MHVSTITQDRLYPIVAGAKELIIPICLPVGGSYGSGGEYPRGCVVGPTDVQTPTNEKRTLAVAGGATGYKLTINFLAGGRVFSTTTANLVTTKPTEEQVETALESMFGNGNVVCVITGDSYELEFQRVLGKREIGGVMSATGQFTGGVANAITVTRTAKGSVGTGQFDKYDNATVAKAVGALVHKQLIDPMNGQVAENGYAGQPTSSPMTVNGIYRVGDLPNIDDAAVADLGKFILGNSVTNPEAWVAFNGGA